MIATFLFAVSAAGLIWVGRLWERRRWALRNRFELPKQTSAHPRTL